MVYVQGSFYDVRQRNVECYEVTFYLFRQFGLIFKKRKMLYSIALFFLNKEQLQFTV